MIVTRRFSIRFLFVLTTVCALVINVTWGEAKRRTLISDIRSIGGKVEFNDDLRSFFRSERVWRIKMPAPALQYDFRGSRLRQFKNLNQLSLFVIMDDTHPLPARYSDGKPRPFAEEYTVPIGDDLWDRFDAHFEPSDPYSH